MSLRHCKRRVCGRGQTTSKPSIHRAPVYVTARVAQNKTTDKSLFVRWRCWLFISSMGAFVWDLKAPTWEHHWELREPYVTFKTPHKCSHMMGWIVVHSKIGHQKGLDIDGYHPWFYLSKRRGKSLNPPLASYHAQVLLMKELVWQILFKVCEWMAVSDNNCNNVNPQSPQFFLTRNDK